MNDNDDNLLAPAPASEPLGPTAEVSPSPKAAQSPASEAARGCDADEALRADIRAVLPHVNLEFLPKYAMDAYSRLRNPAPTPPTTVQADAGQVDQVRSAEPVAGQWSRTNEDARFVAEVLAEVRDQLTVQADRDAGRVRLSDQQVDALVVLVDNIAAERPYALDSLIGTIERFIETRLTEVTAKVDAYERGIAWDTTCTSCAGLLEQLGTAEARLSEARGERPSGFWSQRQWEDWSNELAMLLPEDAEGWPGVNPEGAQESIIEASLRHLTALAARQSDPDATERVEWGVRFEGADYPSLFQGVKPTGWIDKHPGSILLRRTVTTGEWTEVGE